MLFFIVGIVVFVIFSLLNLPMIVTGLALLSVYTMYLVMLVKREKKMSFKRQVKAHEELGDLQIVQAIEDIGNKSFESVEESVN